MEEDVIYVERNAVDPRDHRVPVGPGRVIRPVPVNTGRVYTTGQVVTAPSAAPVYTQAPAPVYSASPMYAPAPAYPQMYPQSWYGGNPLYGQPMWGAPWGLGGLFGGVNAGKLVDLAAQGFAAIRTLPVAPTATGDVSTDMANLVTYQEALADHGKTDERIRTVAHIIGVVLGG